jgi:GTP-binding protein
MPKINFSKAQFLGAFVNIQEINELNLPEFIIMGRSNVGKSSLINALTRKKIAKTSSTPGKTETINQYLIDDAFSLYDLPGYGFAKFREKRLLWGNFIDKFIEQKGNKLKAFLVLIDSRHDISQEDVAMLEFLQNFSSPLAIVLTKVDKLKTDELKKNTEIISHQIKQCFNNPFVILPFSSKIPSHCKHLEKMIELWVK